MRRRHVADVREVERQHRDTHILHAGDSVHFDAVRPHLYSNHGTVPARGVWFVFGRREHAQTMPDQAGTRAGSDGALGSADDVLRAMDRL